MMGINLHGVVRGIITSVYPDEAITLYQADGQQNVKGVIKAMYKAPQAVKGNIQPLDTQTLAHLERIGDTKASMNAFLYSDPASPVKGTQRLPTMRGGDIIQRSDGTYWLITSLIEDWNAVGWCNVGITQQVTPPDFSASEWVGGGDGA